ncbi:MAG: cupin domain-containing protein [Planctomycetaceae bacterium]|nr:cupin domain-containing protein [Planctomycetaceae bacterium]
MKRFAAILLVLSSCSGPAPEAKAPAGGKVTAVQKQEVAWQQAPGLTAGLQTAIEWGDPAKSAYQALIRFPAGYTVPPHYHKFDEFATVASGAVVFGQGEAIDDAKGIEVSAGGYITIPANTAHWAKCTQEAVIVRFSAGPRELTSLKPGEKSPGRAPFKVVQPKDVPWEDAPGMVAGVKTVLQYGDPKTGPYIILLKFPKDLVNPPHWHTADEAVTILSGTMITGEGPTIDDATGKAVSGGGYFIIPGGTAHWGKVPQEVVLTRLGNGPRDIHYFDKK